VETCRNVIICEIIVLLLVIVQNNKKKVGHVIGSLCKSYKDVECGFVVKRCHIIVSMLMNYKFFHLTVLIQLLYLCTVATAGS